MWDLCGSRWRQLPRSGGHGTRARSIDAGGAGTPPENDGADSAPGAGPRAVGADEAAAGGNEGAAEPGDGTADPGDGAADPGEGDGEDAPDRDDGDADADDAAAAARRRRGSFAAARSVRRRSGVSAGVGAATSGDRTGTSGADRCARTNVTPKTITTALTSDASVPITDGLPRVRGALGQAS